jgi:hypothetical protein
VLTAAQSHHRAAQRAFFLLHFFRKTRILAPALRLDKVQSHPYRTSQ